MEVHDHISSLNSTKISWTLKVRLTRSWVSRSRKSGVVVYHNIILLDGLNTHIHAIVRPDIWAKFENILFEGGLYLISNIYVEPALGNDRPVTNSKIIRLLPSSVVTLHEDDNLMIPLHKFELSPLGVLGEIMFGDRSQDVHVQSIDVIGVLEDLQPVQRIYTCDGLEEIVKFNVSDGSDVVEVSYYGPLNDETRRLYAHHLERPVVVVLASFKLSQNQGIVRLHNIPSSKIYVNLDAEDVSFFRNWLIQNGH